MFRTSISTADPTTGDQLAVPDDLFGRVKRASEILEEQLGDLTAKFPIEATWQFVRHPDGGVGVELDLTTSNVGVLHYAIPIEDLRDDDAILRRLRRPLWHFGQTLSNVLKAELERIRRDLDTLATVTGE